MNPTACKSCGLPIFHGPAGYAGPQCMCRWTNAAPRQPEGEGLEVVAWQDAENPLYTTAERRVLHDWANNGYPIVELCRLSDHQRAIAELQAKLDDPDYPPKYSRRLIAELREECNTLRQQLAERDAEIERLSMQLAACGVVALANTPESAGEARQMHPDYMSASCSDVADAVDREMALRQQRDKLAGLLREKFPRIDPEKPYPMDEVEHHCEYTLYQERERLHREIDAALAEVSK